jgi:hypothetical protein
MIIPKLKMLAANAVGSRFVGQTLSLLDRAPSFYIAGANSTTKKRISAGHDLQSQA